MAHDRKNDPTGEEEVRDEAEVAADRVDEDLTPLEQAELRRRLALEMESFENGMEG